MQNPVKAALKSGRTSIGSWITLAHTTVTEIMARSGFEWLAIDLEHSRIGIQDVEPLVQVIEAAGSVPLVRLSSNDPVLAKRVMDAGAYGVIVPMVNTAREAEQAVRSVKYPPDGDRGVGLYRAQGFGTKFEEYKNTVNRESLVIVQIEHKLAIRNIRAIVSVPGVDGVMIGPYDLSGSLGVAGKLDHPLVTKAQDKMLSAAREGGVAAGIHVVSPSPGQVVKRVKEGYSFIAYSTDAIILNEKCREDAARLKLSRD